MAVHSILTSAKVLVSMQGRMLRQEASLQKEDGVDTGRGDNNGELRENTEDEVLIFPVLKY